MPWHEVSRMSQRQELVTLAAVSELPFKTLCERYGVSRKTAYKWRDRFEQQGESGLVDRARRPLHSPGQTPPEVEACVVEVRQRHPAWGARKIKHFLEEQEILPAQAIPCPSTITAILRRQGWLEAAADTTAHPWRRFEHPAPNQLWQMDFKGPLRLSDAAHSRCHPLTVLDDHSRFALGLRACPNQQGATVQAELTEIFRRYGLPDRMTMDNGSPWGDEAASPYTPLTVWLLRLHIQVTHSRPYHPQTQGKDERFHRTLQAELLSDRTFPDFECCQRAFDEWRTMYNLERPHQALDYAVPARRYQPSLRAYPDVLPPIEYGPDDQVRRVQDKGRFRFRGRSYQVSRAFRGYPIALRPTASDGEWQVWFCHQALGWIDERNPETDSTVTHVSVHL